MKVAVIGAGYQGRLHVESLAGIDDVELVALCDTDADRAEGVAATFGISHSYADYRQLLDRHDLDLVTICTMPVHHCEMAVAALDAGAHVLCEKPMAMDAIEGRAMVDAAAAAGRLLTIGFNLRYTRSAGVLKRFVDSGRFGEAVYTRAWTKSSQIPWWGQHYRREFPVAARWHRPPCTSSTSPCGSPATRVRPLRRPRRVGLFPTKRGATAPEPAAADAYDVEDLISGHVRFDNGFWMSIEGSWVDNRPSIDGVPSWDYSLDAIGEHAQMQFDPLSINVEDESGAIVSALAVDEEAGVSFPDSTAALIADVVDAIRDVTSTVGRCRGGTRRPNDRRQPVPLRPRGARGRSRGAHRLKRLTNCLGRHRFDRHGGPA